LGPVDFVTTWGSRCGVVVVAAKGAQKDSCGFFEAIFRGVFGGSSHSLDGMLLLRKKVMSLFFRSGVMKIQVISALALGANQNCDVMCKHARNSNWKSW